jgi:hypothetical protein
MVVVVVGATIIIIIIIIIIVQAVDFNGFMQTLMAAMQR